MKTFLNPFSILAFAVPASLFIAPPVAAAQLNVTCDAQAVGAVSFIAEQTFSVGEFCRDNHMNLVESAVNDNDTHIAALDGVVSNVISNVNSNTNLIAINTSHITTNTSNIATNSTNIATNTTNIATNTAAIAALSIDNSAAISALRSDLSAGLAMSNAMEVFLPDPGARFRLNVGVGYYQGATAYGVTGAGRLADGTTAVYFGVGTDGAFSQLAAKAGVSWQW